MVKKSNGKECLDPLMEGYLEYLADVARKAPRTVIDVRCTLKRVSQGMTQLCREKSLWEVDLVDFLQWIERERQQGRSGASLNKQLSHLRGFLDYAWRSGRSRRNVLDGFHVKDAPRRRMPEALSLDEAKRLVETCPRKTAAERRDRVVVFVLYGCGLRTKELCELRLQDVNAQRREIFIRNGKGDRQRVVPVPEAVHTELLAYLLERGGKRGPLFRGQKQRSPITTKDVCQVVRVAAERAGLNRPVKPKMLRHSYATHLMDQGVDLAVIARLMGHRSPAETGVYLHVLKDRPQEAVARLGRRQGGQS